jgi:hypothetical protein
MQLHAMASTMPSSNAYLMSGVALAQMEVLYGKLTLLQFPIYLDATSSKQRSDGSRENSGIGPMKCRMSPLHFAGDLTSILGRRAHEFPATQFHTYVQVAEWLVQRAKGLVQQEGAEFTDELTIDVFNEPPMSIAKVLLRMAQVCPFS